MAERSLNNRLGFSSLSPAIGSTPRVNQERLLRIGTRFVLAIAILGLIAAVAISGFRMRYDGDIYPGVSVSGVALGGLSKADAREAIQSEATSLEETRAYFDFGDQHWAPTLADLGVTVDVDRTLSDAFAVGRESDGSSRISSSIDSLRNDTVIPLQVSVSSDTLENWANGVTEELGITPQNAELVVENGATVLTPEANGTVVDVASLQRLVNSSVRTLDAPSATLPVKDFLPTVYASDLQPSKDALDQMLAEPVTVGFDSQKWEIDPVDFGNFTSIVVDPNLRGSEAVSIDIDKRGLADYLGNLVSDSINTDPINAKVAWGGDGGLTVIAPSQDGVRVLTTDLADDVVNAFSGGHQPVKVPTQVLKAEVNGSNLDSLGITTKLGVGSSNFDGSADSRSTNIQVGTQLLNGTLIPPHGEFSFNHSIGVITTDAGFVEGDIIDGEAIGRDVGGGICQVSTTVYRAALYSGMPITEWWPHRYRLGFYELDNWPVGIDASILQPEGDPFSGGDFKFVNPSDSWMLVEAYVDWPRVYVILYGPDLGYTVNVTSAGDNGVVDQIPPSNDSSEIVDDSLPPGSIVQNVFAGPGYDVDNYRVVYDSDGNVVREDDWPVTYVPRANIWKVSPDMQGLSPAG